MKTPIHAKQKLRLVLSNKLREVLDEMDVPMFRREQMHPANLAWLNRNLAINNGDHPRLREALELVSNLIKLQEDE